MYLNVKLRGDLSKMRQERRKVMSERMISVKILGKQKTYPYGTSYAQIATEYQGSTRYSDAICA